MKTEELRAARNRTWLVLTSLVLLGCNASKPTKNEVDAGPYIAVTSNFQGYRNWRHSPATATNAPSGVHTNGPATVYWNDLPPRGSEEFPVGTLIVSETDSGVTPAQVFAMAKRGGGYNASGAVGWEWFELLAGSGDGSTILWRGLGPPNNGTYGDDPTACNTCHGRAEANDFVWSDALQLSSL